MELEPTKRNVISLIGKFFDPVGFISPVVVSYKILMQALRESKIGWDEVIPDPLLVRWHNLVAELTRAKAMIIPRSYTSRIEEKILSFKLCGYCDASLAAYAAVVHLLIETENQSYMRFVTSNRTGWLRYTI